MVEGETDRRVGIGRHGETGREVRKGGLAKRRTRRLEGEIPTANTPTIKAPRVLGKWIHLIPKSEVLASHSFQVNMTPEHLVMFLAHPQDPMKCRIMSPTCSLANSQRVRQLHIGLRYPNTKAAQVLLRITTETWASLFLNNQVFVLKPQA